MLADVLDPYTLRMVLLPVIVGLVVCGFLVLRFVTRSAVKVALLALLVVVGIAVSEERADLSDCVATSDCTLFGRAIDVPGR